MLLLALVYKYIRLGKISVNIAEVTLHKLLIFVKRNARRYILKL